MSDRLTAAIVGKHVAVIERGRLDSAPREAVPLTNLGGSLQTPCEKDVIR